MNLKIKNILSKKNKTKIISLTAYSRSVAKILDDYCDIILVETQWQTFFMDIRILIK